MIVKCNRKQKFSTREYTRCQRCGRPHSVYRKFGLCRVCFRELALKGQLVRHYQRFKHQFGTGKTR